MTTTMTSQQWRESKAKKPSKYRNKPIYYDGILFDSKRQAQHYASLKMMEAAGSIKDIVLEPFFILAPSVKIAGEARARPALRVKLDFRYTITETGEHVWVDVKSPATAKATSWRIRQHLLKSIHNIDVRIVR